MSSPFDEDEADKGITAQDIPRLTQLSLESKTTGNGKLAAEEYERAAELYIRGVSRLHDLDLSEHPAAKEVLLACYLNLALCRLKMDEPLRAKNAATRALALAPNSEKGLYRRAEAAIRLGESTDAEEDLRALLAEKPAHEAAAKLLKQAQIQRKSACGRSKEQASRMLASGGLYENRSAPAPATSDDAGQGAGGAGDSSKAEREMAARMLGSGGLYGAETADAAKAAARVGATLGKMSPAELDTTSRMIDQRKLWGAAATAEQAAAARVGKAIEELGENVEFAELPSEVLALPPNWEVVEGENGEEIWRRKAAEAA